jgi:dihydroorotate dehydrogenase (NAD+) catalytic subunit
MLNSIGLENGGLEYFVRYRVPELEALPTQVLVNVVGNSIEEYASVCQRLDKIGAVDGFEINISCPNVRHGCRFSSDPADAERLMRALRASTGKLLMAKLSPNVTDIAMIGRAAVAGGAQALSLINTLLGMAIDPHTRRPRLANLTGGLSGPAIHPVAVRCVYQVAQACPGIPIVGVGGVRTLEDALEFFIAGASAVQIGTAIYSDPGLLNQLPGQLSSWLASHGLNSQKDLIGTLRPF